MRLVSLDITLIVPVTVPYTAVYVPVNAIRLLNGGSGSNNRISDEPLGTHQPVATVAPPVVDHTNDVRDVAR